VYFIKNKLEQRVNELVKDEEVRKEILNLSLNFLRYLFKKKEKYVSRMEDYDLLCDTIIYLTVSFLNKQSILHKLLIASKRPTKMIGLIPYLEILFHRFIHEEHPILLNG